MKTHEDAGKTISSLIEEAEKRKSSLGALLLSSLESVLFWERSEDYWKGYPYLMESEKGIKLAQEMLEINMNQIREILGVIK